MSHSPLAPSSVPSTDHQRFRDCRFFPALDGLRAFSILAVIWHHAGAHTFPAWVGSRRGFLGVDMFFVLSGFLISTLLLRERDATGRISLKGFYVRRSLRIFPPYYALLVALLLLAFLPGRESFRRQYLQLLPYYFTYTSNWIPDHATNLEITWSLATEEQFYLAWPAVQAHAPPPLALTVLGASLAVNQAINFGLLDDEWQHWFGVRQAQLNILQVTFTPICLGVLLAWLLHHPRTFRATAPLWSGPGRALVWTLVTLGLCQIPLDLQGSLRLAIQCAMVGALAAVLLAPPTTTAWLAWGPLRRCGEISYGMYLYHLWVRSITHPLLDHAGISAGWLEFLACLVGTWLVAEASFRWLEKPCLQLKSRWSPPSALVAPSAGRSNTSH